MELIRSMLERSWRRPGGERRSV